MNCFPEFTYSVYVDGELPPDEVRAVDAHLVQCQRCRRSILALQEEGAVLRDVMREISPELARTGAAPARGAVVGLGPAIALTAVALAAGGWLLEQRLPQGVTWMNPLTFFGAYDMFFDFVFMARDRAPAVFDLGIAVGATAGIASLLTFLGSALLRRFVRVGSLGMLVLAIIAGAAAPSRAIDLRWGQQDVTVQASETVEESLVASAENIVIDGLIDGDVFALAERVEIRGTIRGNVLAGGREVVVSGKVDGSLHMFCETCTLEGEVRSNLYGAAEHVNVRDEARIGRDAFLFGDDVRMDGRTARDLFAAASSAAIRGAVGRSVTTRTERVSVLETASIGGDLDVKTPAHGRVEIASGASIGGETLQAELESPMPDHQSRFSDPDFYMRVVVLVASAFLVGMLLHTVVPQLFDGRLETGADFVRCLGFGFVALVATPLLLVVCFVTVVGIPIGIIGAFVYLTTLFVSVIVTAALVGSAVTRRVPEGTYGFGSALLLGLVILVIAVNLPFVGGLIRLLVGLTGMGLLAVSAIDAWRSSRPGLV